MTDPLVLGGRSFRSRLIVGTGKFASPELMTDALAASGAELVTVAVRRVEIDRPQDPITSFIDRDRYLIVPNTSGAATAEEAVRLARLARTAGLPPWIKVEALNALNNQKLISWDTSVTADLKGPLDANGLPLNYITGANFGKATSTANYPRPRPGMDGGRTYIGSFGVRF